ncbi:MAG: hypothetical protein KJ666_00380 [Bacteroidetes bacterium]|nr:hypothetical protein [Bacteroidota bacterium]
MNAEKKSAVISGICGRNKSCLLNEYEAIRFIRQAGMSNGQPARRTCSFEAGGLDLFSHLPLPQAGN